MLLWRLKMIFLQFCFVVLIEAQDADCNVEVRSDQDLPQFSSQVMDMFPPTQPIFQQPLNIQTGVRSGQPVQSQRGVVAAAGLSVESAESSSAADLMHKLFANYHKATQVVKPLVVHMNLLLIKVKTTIEKEGIFESVIALFIEWNDPRLTWDPQEYGNITYISLDPDVVGTPDITLTNSADHLYSITRDYRFNVRVVNDGSLRYVPTGTARTWCDMKLMTFPFDYQKCSLEFESWSLDASSLTFDGLSELLLDTSFISQLWTICKWKATTYNHTYFTNETFTRLRFDISVKRKSTFYIINLIFPCATLSMIQMAVFLISSQETTCDRIGFGTTNLLTLVVFQTIVTEEMPKTSDAVTALSKYIIALIVLSAIGIFESVVVERFLMTYRSPPPRIMQAFFSAIPMLFRELPDKHAYEDYLLEEPVFPTLDHLRNGVGETTEEESGDEEEPNKEREAETALQAPLDGNRYGHDRHQELPSYEIPRVKRYNFSRDSLMSHQVFNSEINDNPFSTANDETKYENLEKSAVNSESSLLGSSKDSITIKKSLTATLSGHRYQPPKINFIKSMSQHTKIASQYLLKIVGSENNEPKETEKEEKKAYFAQQDSEEAGPFKTNSSFKGLRYRRHARASSKAILGYKARNARLWREVAYKVDVLTFFITGFLVMVIPGFLFLPLIINDFAEYNCDNSVEHIHS